MPLSLIRKIASILLLLCFFLPLSTCTIKTKATAKLETQTQAASNSKAIEQEVIHDSALHGYDIMQAAFDNLKKGETIGGSMTLLAVLLVFFLPCGLLRLKETPQAAFTFFASIGSGYALFFWVLFGRTPQMGGVLAIACWCSLFSLCLVVLGRWYLHWWRQRH